LPFIPNGFEQGAFVLLGQKRSLKAHFDQAHKLRSAQSHLRT